MKVQRAILILVVVGLAGCAARRGERQRVGGEVPAAKAPEWVPMDLGAVVGKVVIVNAGHQFVVVDFRGQRWPGVGTEMAVRRGGKQVGRIRLTEPVRGQFVTADVLEGDLHAGDEVRSK